MTGPCTGLAVLDLSRSLAGSLTTMLLADNGADVTMVEPPAGHPLRADAGFLVWARGKQSLRADVEGGDGTLVRALAVQADVVVDSFAAVEGRRLGLNGADLLAQNPCLLICSLPAFGPSDPDEGLPADDALIAARAGILGAQPGYRAGPAFVYPPLSSYGAALLAVQALGSALYARARDGRGRAFSIPTLHGALAMQASHLLEVERGDVFVAPRRTPLDGRPLYRLYQCQDGRWIHFGVLTPRFWPGVALATGHPEWISDSRYQAMPNLATTPERDAFAEVMAAEIDKRPYAEWDRVLGELDLPYAPALTVDEFMREPQLLSVDMLIEVDDPRVGRMQQLGLPIQFRRTPGAIRGPAPSLGQHDASTRARIAPPSSAEPSQSELQTGPLAPPLAGIRILDLSSFIAGPLGPVFLADLGADVIKVESPEGDGLRTNKGFLGWNRGKRGLALNLKLPEAREILYRLVVGADVLLENMRPGVAERLGIGYDELRRRNPRLVYCSVTAYGASGPWRDKPGFDPLMQARSGIERAQGGLQNPPTFLLVPVTDNTCAMLNAAGIALALYERERSGLGQKLETSLLRAACLLQSDSLVAYEGQPSRPANDPQQFGPRALHRLYRCADGWIFLAAADDRSCTKLTSLFGLDESRGAQPADRRSNRIDELRLAENLSERFAAMSVASTLERLRESAIPAVQVSENYAEHFADDRRLLGDTRIVTYEHPRYGRVRQPAVLAPLSDAPASATMPAPLIGQHTRVILAELGYDEREIAGFLTAGVAVQSRDVQERSDDGTNTRPRET